MKKTIITALLALVALAGQAQEIRTNEPTLDDYLQLLNAKGYIVYSFDMKDFKGKQYEPVVMEYANSKEAKDVLGFSFSFPIGDRLVIGFAPSSNDSTYVYSFQSVGGGGFNATLKLHPVSAPEMPTKQAYRYESRPFELVAPVETGKVISLVLFGSYWYEEETGVSRFCGDKLIKSDLSSDLIKSIPHFYVLGIRIR